MPSSFTQILHATRSGMVARLFNLDVTSNNLSNVNTAGFKRNRANFQELLHDAQLNGSRIQSTQPMMEQGSLRATENPLDLAISGAGFFAVTLPDQRTAYTRNGEFYLDAGRRLVNGSGYPLVWDGQIPEGAENVHVNPDGSVMVLQDGAWSAVGNIQLSRFNDPSGLTGYGQTLWLASPVSGEAQVGTPGVAGFGIIQGKALETANVNMAEEMTSLVSLQRSFEMSLRTFQQTDQMLSQAIHLRRG